MPRIRTVKPQYWSTPEPPSRDARLLYVAMWNWADDEGVGTANPKELAAFAFPYDDDMGSREVQGLLTEIAVSFECVFYTVGGRPYYCIQNFRDHQVINRPTASKLPKPDQAEKWLYQQEVSDHGELTESAVNTPITEIGSRKKEVGTTSGYVSNQRSESNARESNGRVLDGMGRPAMSLNAIAGIDQQPSPPPPPDRGISHEAREIVRSTLPAEIPRQIKTSCADAVQKLLNDGESSDECAKTLQEWFETDERMHAGTIKFVHAKRIQQRVAPVRTGKEAKIARTLAMKDNTALLEPTPTKEITDAAR